MKEIKISHKIEKEVGIKQPTKWFTHWTVELNKDNNKEYYLTQKIDLWFWLLLVIPLHIFKIFWCIWSCGLKNYEFETREVDWHIINPNQNRRVYNALVEKGVMERNPNYK